MPCSRQVRMMRTAISPRLAIRTLRNIFAEYHSGLLCAFAYPLRLCVKYFCRAIGLTQRRKGNAKAQEEVSHDDRVCGPPRIISHDDLFAGGVVVGTCLL